MLELGLRSIVRKKKPTHVKGTVNKMFPNLLSQNFKTEAPNEIWCTDFTDPPQKNGTMNYNGTIINLYDRCAVATLNEKHITTELAIETLKTALKRHKLGKGLLLHSDQGSQFTSKAFNDFCKKNHVQQRMSRTGCRYDNAPMERFYHTLKNEYFNLFTFNSSDELNQGIYEFIYVKYNHLRHHFYDKFQRFSAVPLLCLRNIDIPCFSCNYSKYSDKC